MSEADYSTSLKAAQEALPPLSNRGVTGCQGLLHQTVSVSLDWLRYSVSWSADMERWIQLHPLRVADELFRMAFRRAVMPSEAFFLTGEAIPPPRGYNACLGLSYGSLRLHTERPEQKIGVELTGKDMSGLRAAGVNHQDLLRFVVAAPDSKVSRLDVAVDVFNSGGDVLDVLRAFEAGDLVTAARQVDIRNPRVRVGNELVSRGKTVYVGSLSSDCFLRVYDKGLEQGLDDTDWIRIELQLGGHRAYASAVWLAAANGDFVERARGCIRSFCEAPTVGWFTRALDGPLVDVPQVPRRDSDRKRWLLRQVIPALAAELLECEKVGDWEVYEAFAEVLERYRNR